MHYKPQSFEAVIEVGSECEDCTVVHGWVHHDGQWILHAWGETDEAVYDLTESREPQHRAEYYARHGITEERLHRYSRLEFFTLLGDTKSFGPYDKELFFAETTNVDPLEKLKG